MTKRIIWGYRPNDNDMRIRKDIESVLGSLSHTDYFRYCSEFTWRNSRIGLERLEQEHQQRWMETRRQLDEFTRIQDQARDRLGNLDITTISDQLRYLFVAMKEFPELDQQFPFPQNRRFKESRVLALKEDLPLLKGLSDEKCITMIEDQSIIEYYLTQELLSESEVMA